MRGEREFLEKMKGKILEAIDTNEFDKYLMGESKYLVQSREIPYITPGTGNLYNYMTSAMIQLQKSNQYEINFGNELLNGTEQIIRMGPDGLLNSVEVIRSILNVSKEDIKLLGITGENLKGLTQQIREEASVLNGQLKETISKRNSRMTVYDCLEFYNDDIYEHVGTKLI